MPIYDKDDIVEVKKREKRKRRFKKFLIFLSIILIIEGLYYYRDSWLPKLQGIGEKYQTIFNDGELAVGNFPIEISGGSFYQLEYSDKNLFLLNDAYLYIYTVDGSLVEKRQHAYSNAVMQNSNGKALIFESGGYNFRVDENKGKLYSDTMDNNIIFGRISKEGYVAIVTTSSKYASVLTVYDENGNFVYSRDCMERIMDVSFSDDSKGCIVSFVNAENGSIVNVTERICFTETELVWASNTLETFSMHINSTNDGGAFVLGNDKSAYYNNAGELVSNYIYEGDFAGSDFSNNKTAVIINNEQRRNYTLVLWNSPSAEPVFIQSEELLKDVIIYNNIAYIMTSDKIMAYDFVGQLRATVEISDSYSSFRRSDEYIFLMGYNKIDRIDYLN